MWCVNRPRAGAKAYHPLGEFCKHIFSETVVLSEQNAVCLPKIEFCSSEYRAFEDTHPRIFSEIPKIGDVPHMICLCLY